jgi:hypothetical protein
MVLATPTIRSMAYNFDELAAQRNAPVNWRYCTFLRRHLSFMRRQRDPALSSMNASAVLPDRESPDRARRCGVNHPG